MSRLTHSRGFTLLEAIVAVAIIGVALVPIITFISQMVDGLARAGDSNARNLAQQSVIELLETLNPLEDPVGEDRIGDLVVRWQSDALIQPRAQQFVGVGLPSYSVGFYAVTVSVDRADRGPWFSFDMRKVGYRRNSAQQLPGMGPGPSGPPGMLP